MNTTGKIIPIAFPDTFVRYSEEKILNYFFPFVGLGRKKYIKAGHAILLLVENKTGNIQYFDFGRYITPLGKGRVRSAKTDVELHIPIKAEINSSGHIENIDKILLWLDAHPEKTHGSRRLVASICHDVDYKKAIHFLTNLQDQGSIPYLTFGNVGSNCSRLVADTLIYSSNDAKIIKVLKRNSSFTPSPLGNVKYGASGGKIYQVLDGKIGEYDGHMLKENLTNYFDPRIPKIVENKLSNKRGEAQLLSGIGASAYFELQATDCVNKYVIKRYTPKFEKDFEGEFTIDQSGFTIKKPYHFVYDSNCSFCHIKQNDKVYRFDLIEVTYS
ncbi:DUF6695 family protein [Aquimarina agarivorans]|uniref:DUF6695 family protein n=1 Tax=Aquimarina agarivorans TaxID=980584 RepID=UPI000248FB55|nr:DUF6695 family protein [Aquimarina agarivorans]